MRLPLALALAAGLAGAAHADRAATLRINLGAQPESLDPTLATDLVGGVVFSGIMEGLVDLGEDGKVEPRVAMSWKHNDDYTSWTFTLRPDARWHNGDTVTAHDFVYGVRRILTPSLGAQYANYVFTFLKDGEAYFKAGGLNGTQPLTSVNALDDHTLEYLLANPTPYFPSVLQLSTWLPIHRRTVESVGPGWAGAAETYMGNGPFRVVSYRQNDKLVAEKAATYWNAEAIHWRFLEFYFIESESTANQAFLRGDLDISLTVPLAEIEYWRGRPEYRSWTAYGTYYIGFNGAQPPFNDRRVRKAFSMALNRRLITTQVTRRNEPVSQGIVPRGGASPRGGDYRDHAGDMVGRRDVEAAQALLREAGYDANNPLPALEYIYDTSEQHKLIAEQMQSMWKRALGVDVRLQNVEWGVRINRQRLGQYQIVRSGWFGDYIDPLTFLDLFTSNSTHNTIGFRNRRYDEAVEAARRERDPIKREDFLITAERILIEEEAAIAPLYTYVLPMLVRRDLRGVGRVPTGSLIFIHSRPASVN
jgi:oligopeptide transport system substrate-binding protein